MNPTQTEIVDYYNQLAEAYDDHRFNNTYGRFIDAEERRTLDRLLTGTGPAVLEMACGTGRLLRYASHGIDASEKMLAVARRKFPDKHLQQAFAQSTPFADGRFDAVYTFHLMMHLTREEIGAIVREAYRILKPGGRLIFDIPSARRRNLLGRNRRNGWHGNTALNAAEVEQLAQGLFRVASASGILFLPVHRLPVSWREQLIGLDLKMAGGLLKVYSSYLIFELVKL